ncbi:hypothetical protein LTS18_008811, partial [Coniosporium uncinatum]
MRRDRRPAEQPPRSAVVTDGFLKRENYIDNVWQGFPIPTKRSVDAVVTVTSTVFATPAPSLSLDGKQLDAQSTLPATASPTDIDIVVNLPAAPSPKKGGLSDATEHTLIAAGSIGGTLLLIFAVFVLYRMRKGYLLKHTLIFNAEKQKRWKTPEVTEPLGRDWGTRYNTWNKRASSWNGKNNWDFTDAGLANGTLPQLPGKSLVRPETGASDRPLVNAMQMPGRHSFREQSVRNGSVHTLQQPDSLDRRTAGRTRGSTNFYDEKTVLSPVSALPLPQSPKTRQYTPTPSSIALPTKNPTATRVISDPFGTKS